MPKTVTLPLLGIQELAAHLGVTPMDVKNWRRRDRRERLPEPVAELASGPIWTASQFPAKVKRELVGSGPSPTSSASRRSGRPRKTSRTKVAKSRTPGSKTRLR